MRVPDDLTFVVHGNSVLLVNGERRTTVKAGDRLTVVPADEYAERRSPTPPPEALSPSWPPRDHGSDDDPDWWLLPMIIGIAVGLGFVAAAWH